MAAQQMAILAKQKKLALKHFAQYNKRLETLENEKSAKVQAKVDAKQELVHVAQQRAARIARFAQAQMAAADIQKSETAISKANAAGEMLKRAIYKVRTVDTRARGHASLEIEKQMALAKKKKALESKQKALAKALEKKAKLAAKTKEAKKKRRTKKKEIRKKKAYNEKAKKHAKIVKESFTKGVRFAREKTAKKAIASVRAKEKRKKNAQLRKIAAIAKAKNAKEHAKKELNKKHTLAKTLQSQAKQLAKAAGVHGRKYVRIAKQSLQKFLFALLPCNTL